MNIFEMNSAVYFYSVIFHISVTSIDALPEHRMKIPNSMNVADPCQPNKFVAAIGHLNTDGGGILNPFGLDFERLRSWSLLCPLDSDNDGFTNGQELGDPNCKWTIGSKPERVVNVTHPGICTPINSEKCRNQNVCGPMLGPECAFSGYALGIFIFGTFLSICLTLFKLVSNHELKSKLETGHWPSKFATLPYDKPGFSWDT